MDYITNIRKMVGHQPLILVGVTVAVINDKQQILLQERNDGLWGTPGGIMELGESTEETGRREVLEETGIEISKMSLVDVYSGKQYYRKLANGDEFYPVTICYRTSDIVGGTLKPDGIESLDAKFFSMNELPKNLSPLLKRLILEHRKDILQERPC